MEEEYKKTAKEILRRNSNPESYYGWRVDGSQRDAFCEEMAEYIEDCVSSRTAELEAKIFVYEEFIKSAGYKILPKEAIVKKKKEQ